MNNLVRQQRQANKWSQEQFAELVDVSRQTIISIEKGKFDPSLQLALRIAKLLKMPVEAIFIDSPTTK